MLTICRHMVHKNMCVLQKCTRVPFFSTTAGTKIRAVSIQEEDLIPINNTGGGRICAGAGVKLVSIGPPRGEQAPRRTTTLLDEQGDDMGQEPGDEDISEEPWSDSRDDDFKRGDDRDAAGSPPMGMSSPPLSASDQEEEEHDDVSDGEEVWTFLLRAHHKNGHNTLDRMIEEVSVPRGGQRVTPHCTVRKATEEQPAAPRVDMNASEVALYHFCMEHGLSTSSADALIAMIKNPAFNTDDIRFLRLNSYLQRTYVLMSSGIHYRSLQNVTTDGTNSGDFWYRLASDIACDMLSDAGFAQEMQWEFKKDFSVETGNMLYLPSWLPTCNFDAVDLFNICYQCNMYVDNTFVDCAVDMD
jgi:hypothetical protein